MTPLSDALTARNNETTQPVAGMAAPSLWQLAKITPLSSFQITEQERMGREVALARRYYEGDHDINLTSEMRAILQQKSDSRKVTVNLMPSVVNTKVDRITVQAIEATQETEPSAVESDNQQQPATVQPIGPNEPTKWAQEIADLNHFDILQLEVVMGTVLDGNGYVIVPWDNEKAQVNMVYEPAWDGQCGMMIFYPSRIICKPNKAVKTWAVEVPSATDPTKIETHWRTNVYYPDRVEKYVAIGSADYQPYTAEGDYTQAWDSYDGKPAGLPVIHFRNGGIGNYGISELHDAISPQDALNRYNYSSIVAAELTAFAVYKALGFAPDPSVITPGVIINLAKAIPKEQFVEFDKLEPSDLTPLISIMDNTRRLISEITCTPSPDIASSSNTSGEYLKQLEAGLIGKCKRYMVHAGQAWEQTFDLAWNVQQAYGTKKPPPYKRFFCRWKSPEVRNDAVEVQNATALEGTWGPRQTLRAIASIYDLDEEKIDKIMLEKKQDAPAPAFGGLFGAPNSQPPTGEPGAIRGQPLPRGQAAPDQPMTPEKLTQLNAMWEQMKGMGGSGRAA